MSNKYRVTVVGAGDRGSCYMNMLKKYHAGDVEFEAICDILPGRMDKAFESFNFKMKTADYKQAITESKPDIVIIATPAYYHCDMAAFAMEQGCHVLTEKPFDLDLKKCFRLKQAWEKTDKVLAIGLQYRNGASFRAMKHMMESKILGDNVIISYTDIRETRPKIAMHDAQFGNGGPMVDMACHLFDLMRWYYGCDPVKVSALWRSSAINRPSLSGIEIKAPDTAIMTIEYAMGNIGVITMNWGLPAGVNGNFTYYAVGSEGLMDCVEADCVKVRTGGGETTTVGTLPEEASELILPELTVYDNFISEIEGRGKAQASYDEGIISLATSLAAIKSSVIGRPVTIAEIMEEKPAVVKCMKDGI